MTRIRLASSSLIVFSSADGVHHLSVSLGVKIESTDTPATLPSCGPSFFGRPGRLFGVVSWKDIEPPGDLWLSATSTCLVGVPSPDRLEPILGDDEADLGEDADLSGEELDLDGEDADLVGEEPDLAGEEADLGEDDDFGDKEANLGEEEDLAGEGPDLSVDEADFAGEVADFGVEERDFTGEVHNSVV
ncbi:hypothetical protein JOQ06_013401 [Pogonophryne albipinna]|uniref:Uncharacterized protein n=1 Tax=Pogonophryne albipinna TaxID=1090488 RepID=A0AAD6FRE0_9TELE|nr:hypothetical protein JOQ06_012743 [Pogonophryne albipinna]KAJ4944861.1 hypothetical protein JOQ06_013401 [Pogonophryne albipinna]